MISKINLICRWAYPQSYGGIAMHNYFLLEAIKKRIHCETISFDSFENSKFYEKSDIVFTGISPNSYINKMHQLKFSKLKNASRFISDRYISKSFDKILKNHSGLFEFMDIHSEGYYFLKNNPEKRYSSIIRSHTPFTLLKKYFNRSELKGVDTWFAKSSERKIFNWAEHITTPSKDLKNQLIQLFNIKSDKINVIPNVMDTEHFKPLKIDPSDDFNILHVGRFERAKGVETLVEAFIQLAKKYPNIYLTCIGNARGPSLERCKKRLSKKNLSKRVTFKGFITYAELPIHYNMCDIVVVPSEIYESFSYTVAQGMACGKPVLASKIGGIPETVNNGEAGILFQPGNFEDLTEKIELLYLNDYNKNNVGKKAREYVVKNFSLEVLGPKYINYYQSLAP
tara:strand:- start:202 stop:1392 length:1191 start_codon:yes stop_codon:yes gene_type:complete